MKCSPKANYLHTEIKCTFRHLQWHCSSPFHCQGAAMTLSTTAFGIYFYLMTHIYNPTSGEPQTNLAWLALASTGVFITGYNSHFPEKPFWKFQNDIRLRSCLLVLFLFVKCLVLHLSTTVIGFDIQVSLWVGGRSHGWSCLRSSLSKCGDSPALCVSWPTGAWLSSSPRPSTTWWWVIARISKVQVPSKQRVCFLRREMMGCVSWHQMCTLQDSLTSAGTFWLFSSMCFINVLFTMVFVPETKGKTLEQIEATFRGTSGPWNLFAQLTVKQTHKKNVILRPLLFCLFFKAPKLTCL